MRKLFFLFLALVATTTLWAYDFKVGDFYYDITHRSAPYTVKVTYRHLDGTCYEYLTTAVIPESVTYNDITYIVTSIGGSAFHNCSSLTSITIPNSVTSIGGSAFHNCSSLTSITIPNSVTSIGPAAFSGCSSLTSITIPNSVTNIGERAFSGCSSLTSITFPESVTSIGEYAFFECSSLTSVTMGNSVTSIGENAFDGCISLTSITIPNSVTSIGAGAFSSCSSLTSITIPNGVTSIGNYTFHSCSGLTSITIPNSVTSIGNSVFSYCLGLTSVTIPNSVTSIGNYAFSFCSSLPSITIPNGVKSIGTEAFFYCSSLTSVTLGDGVTSIGRHTFFSCSSLRSITIPNSITSIENSAFSGCSSLKSVTIPNSVTNIGESAFSNCSSLTSVTLGDGLTSIGAKAFDYCRNLEEIYCYPITPPAVESSSFYNYNKATLYVPCDSKEVYEEHPIFGKFEKIKGIEGCGEYVTTHIYDTICQGEVYEFGGCLYDATGTYTSTIDLIPTYLYLTVLPSPTVTITVEANDSYIWHDEVYTESGEYKYVTVAANGCDSTEVLLLTIISSDEDEANSPNKIYYTSFDGNIVNPTNPNGFGANIISNTYENGQGVIEFDGPVTTIGREAFNQCVWLTSITLPNTITIIDVEAFRWCSSLVSINIPNNVSNINQNAFVGCDLLSFIEIPSSVTNIGTGAFAQCYFAKEKFINNSACTSKDLWGATIVDKDIDGILIKDNAVVHGRWNVADAIIPQGVTSINDGAFSTSSTLTTVSIPNSVTYIGQFALLCATLKAIYCYATTPPMIESLAVNYDATLYIPCKSLEAYKAHDVWGQFADIQCMPDVESAVDNVTISTTNTYKFLRNGQLLIIQDGVEYNVQGVKL